MNFSQRAPFSWKGVKILYWTKPLSSASEPIIRGWCDGSSRYRAMV